MIPELLIFGLITGLVSGFFGVGGGMVLVPMLLFSGYVMKEAVAISILQMVFSSTYGSFLNVKKQLDIVYDGIMLGIGGFIGGLLSYFITSNISNLSLKYLFVAVLVASILKILQTPAVPIKKQKIPSKAFLILIGSCIGMIAMSIGVGGSIMLTPILVGFMHYNLKTATSLSLFFVMFSAIAGFISLSSNSQMLYQEGIIIGSVSLFGVYAGVKLKHLTNLVSYKKYILSLYILILISMLYKMYY